VAAGRIPAEAVTFDHLRQMALHNDKDLDLLVEKRWGKIRAESSEAKQSFINETKLLLNPSGNPTRLGKGNVIEGKRVFERTCAACHNIFGEGGNIGPELTSADRKNTEFVLMNIVNPSSYIRPEYVNYELETKDGRILNGLIVESSPASVTLLDALNQRAVLDRDQIKALKQSSVSLMPDGLLEALKPQEIIDLFNYLQSDGRKP